MTIQSLSTLASTHGRSHSFASFKAEGPRQGCAEQHPLARPQSQQKRVQMSNAGALSLEATRFVTFQGAQFLEGLKKTVFIVSIGEMEREEAQFIHVCRKHGAVP